MTLVLLPLRRRVVGAMGHGMSSPCFCQYTRPEGHPCAAQPHGRSSSVQMKPPRPVSPSRIPMA